MSIRALQVIVLISLQFLFLCIACLNAQTVEKGSPAADQKKINIAVFQPAAASGISDDDVGLISDRLRVELFNTGKVNVMEREEMATILKEQGFQQSGVCNEESCAAEAGQLLGVEAVISGSIGMLGSIFMLNFRVIDVTSGKVIAAVSRDVRGDIESLIGYIGGIADDLAAIATGASAHSASPESPSARPRQRHASPSSAGVPGNRNRNGIRLLFGAHWGVPQFYLDEKAYPPATHNTFGQGYADTSLFSFTPLLHADLSLIFKIGQYVSITGGPAVQWFTATSTFKSDHSPDETHINYTFCNIGQHLGVSFVKRMLPWKVNAGIFYDLGYCFWSSNIDSVDAYGKSVQATTVLGLSYGDQSNFAWSLGHGVGFQGGLEYVIRERFGISLDFFYRFLNPTFEFGSDGIFGDDINRDRHIKFLTNYSDLYHHPKFNVILPMFGADVGINWYF